MTTQKSKLGEDQSKLLEKQEVLRAQLVARFSAADTRVGASKSTLSFLKNQIEVWNNSGRN
jgi:flagellar hook-associated protein 2